MNLAFLGVGRMGEALLEAMIRAELPIAPFHLQVCDRDAARAAAVAGRLGATLARSNRAAVAWADTVFLCVKPQDLDALLDEIAGSATPNQLFFSIAAGKRLAGIEQRLAEARVIRVMPNVCCLAGEGMNVFTLGARATPDDRETARTLLSACGVAHELPEAQFDAVTALSGSGPAFFAAFLLELVEGAKAEGLTEDDAVVLAVQTLFGTALLLRSTETTPEQLIRSVTSAKGTTAEGLAVLASPEFRDRARGAIAAAARRSRELGAASA